MARAIADGVAAEGIPVEVEQVCATSVDVLPGVAGVILGSPVYYSLPSAGFKTFIDA
jgi:menaquinone-dependent protoporphyrinogen IX oxidase